MKDIFFSINAWSAWAPGIESNADWQAWANHKKELAKDKTLSPKVDFIPPLQRRRLSQLTKMSLKVAFDCTKGLNDIESVFASRYGEWNQTLGLLRQITNEEELSPAGFSLSVHNTAAGIHSLTSKNKATYSAIAACENTFSAALIEAIGKLNEKENKNILLVIADEHVPKLYEETFTFPTLPFAVAFLLSNNPPGKLVLQNGVIETRTHEKDLTICSKEQKIDTLDFLQWYLKEDKTMFQINSPRLQIQRNVF